SSLGLYGFLLLSGYKRVSVITPDRYPSFLQWMAWEQEIVVADQDQAKAEAAILGAKLVFCLDFNGINRVNHLEETLRNAKGKKILIDHHPQPEDEIDIVFSNTNVSSTAELVFYFIAALGGEMTMDVRVAECLYAGI